MKDKNKNNLKQETTEDIAWRNIIEQVSVNSGCETFEDNVSVTENNTIEISTNDCEKKR